MDYTTEVALRRFLAFVALFMIAPLLNTQHESRQIFIEASCIVLMLLLEQCRKCGSLLFFMRGKHFFLNINPLYVAKTCENCGNDVCKNGRDQC